MRRVALLAALAAVLPVGPLIASDCGTCTVPSFAGARSYRNGIEPAVFGDFNGDGVIDYVYRAGDFFITSPGDGNGGFTPAIVSPAGGDPLAAADFDGDGKLDLLIAESGGFNVMLGHGDGTFEEPDPAHHVDAEVFPGVSIFVNDFNGDGVPDIVVEGAVYLGVGDGGFIPQPVDSDDTGQVVAVGDVDGDGRPDLLTTTLDGTYLLRGNGDGTFTDGEKIIADPLSQAAIGDFSGDGIPDIAGLVKVTFDPGFGSALEIRYYFGTGGGAMGAAQRIFLPGSGDVDAEFQVADLDGNGSPDFLVAKENGINIFTNQGSGVFDAQPVVNATGDFAVRDLNGDGFPEIVVNGSEVQVFMGVGDGTFRQGVIQEIQPIFTDFSTTPAVTGDFNGDGHPDVAVVSTGNSFQDPGSITIFLGDGAGHLVPGPVFSSGQQPSLALVADVNGDGKDDLIVVEMRDGIYGASVYLATGGGAFSAPFRILDLSPPFVVADFDHDGKLDLAGGQNGAVAIRRGNGDGTFANAVTTGVEIGQSLLAGDFNGDGFADIVTQNIAANSTDVMLGDGKGGFTTSASLPASTPLVAADFNGDGYLDLVAAGGNDPDALLFLGDGHGGFGEGAEIPFSSNGDAFLAGDLNGDGISDLLEFSDFAAIYTGRSLGSFPEPIGFFGGQGTPLIGDFDGDGQPDLVIFHETAFSFLFNTRCKPTRLEVARQPSTCDTAGSPFSTGPIVDITDDGGNVLSCDSSSVTATLATDSGGGNPLEGNTTVAASFGVADFDGLSLTPPADGPNLLTFPGGRLRFSSPGLLGVGTRNFTQSLAVSLPSTISNCSMPQIFGLPRVFDRYEWTYDGTVISRAPQLVVADPTPGSHSLSVTIAKDGCVASSEATVDVEIRPVAPSIAAPADSAAGAVGLAASTPTAGPYFWAIENGTITAGRTASTVTFDANSGGKVITLSLIILSDPCLSNAGVVQIPVDFLDVPPSNIFHGYVDALEKAGVTLGCGNGNYCPDQGLPREQMAALIARATVGQPPEEGSIGIFFGHYDCDAFGSSYFADVSPTDPFCAAIHYLAAQGITIGCDSTPDFCPGDLVTREQMALFIGRAIAPSATPPSAYSDGGTGRSYDCSVSSPFTDVPSGTPTCNAVGYIWAKGIIDGFGDGTYHPSDVLTRAPAAKFIANAFGLTLGP